MISFIDEHRSVLGVEPICRLLPIAPSTYYEVIAKRRDVGRLSARERNDIAMKVEIRRVFNENFQVYGVRKVWRQLQREGHDIARCTVARLMRMMGASRYHSRQARQNHRVGQGRSMPARPREPAVPCSRTKHALALRFHLSGHLAGLRSTWPSSLMHLPAASSDGEQAGRRKRALSSMPSTRHFMIGDPLIAVGWFIIPTAVRNTCPFAILNGWRRQASSRLSEALATATTTLSPKRSTVFLRPRSSIGEDRGETPWSSLRWNGSTGSTIAAFWSP